LQDLANGTLCVSYVQNTGNTAGAGPTDLRDVYLSNIPKSTWAPPAKTAGFNPSATNSVDAKLGITKTPSGIVADVLTSGYYAQLKWYQPTRATTYASFHRYGKAEWAGVYCMQGQGTTAYFSTVGSSIQLTGAVTLTAAVGLFFGAAVSAII